MIYSVFTTYILPDSQKDLRGVGQLKVQDDLERMLSSQLGVMEK